MIFSEDSFLIDAIPMAFRLQIGAWIGGFFGSLFWSLNILLSLYTGLVYYLLYALPTEHWTASVLMISLPIAWALLLVFGLGWGLSRSGRVWLPIVTLLAGFWLWPRTFGWHPAHTPPTNRPSFSILSFNVLGFNPDDSVTLKRPGPRARPMMDWVVAQEADVKCFQEFYTSAALRDFQVAGRLRRAGYKYMALGSYRTVSVPDTDGIVTFSRFPILRHGSVNFNDTNGLLWTDIRFGHDTVRVINVHLQSMGVRVGKVLAQDEMSGVKHETKSVLERLRFGFVERREELPILENWIATSPYPVLVTGDLNETPYSVVYQRLRQRLNNAFEDGGRGFGFSYNKLPRFIRIDNQFYNSRLSVYDFRTLTAQTGSDHYPIWGRYGIK